MALLDRFKRTKKVVLPEEVNQYYQSQRRERVGVAIILGIVALLVTLLIASGLFYGGRFLYRQVADTNDKQTTTQEQKDQEQKPGESPKSGNNGQSNPNPTPPAPTPQPTPSPTPTPAPATTPALGDEPALPHTGDPGM